MLLLVKWVFMYFPACEERRMQSFFGEVGADPSDSRALLGVLLPKHLYAVHQAPCRRLQVVELLVFFQGFHRPIRSM